MLGKDLGSGRRPSLSKNDTRPERLIAQTRHWIGGVYLGINPPETQVSENHFIPCKVMQWKAVTSREGIVPP